MHLIVGLGNPGAKYAMNRHNIGFIAVDVWLQSIGAGSSASHWRSEHKALTQKVKLDGKEILVAKPQTYMNKSGESVLALMNFYKINRADLLVLHDEVDQGFGVMKLQFNRGHAGQNGIRNISELFGAADYHRLRLGVGRPTHPEFSLGDYVLSNFAPEELTRLPEFLEKAGSAIESFIFDGPAKAATKYNGQL